MGYAAADSRVTTGMAGSGMTASGAEGVKSRHPPNFGPLTTFEPSRSLQAGPLVPEAVITGSGSQRLFLDSHQIGRNENICRGNGLWERHLRVSRHLRGRRWQAPANDRLKEQSNPTRRTDRIFRACSTCRESTNSPFRLSL